MIEIENAQCSQNILTNAMNFAMFVLSMLLLHKIVKIMIRCICKVQTYVKAVLVLERIELFSGGSFWVAFTTDFNLKTEGGVVGKGLN